MKFDMIKNKLDRFYERCIGYVKWIIWLVFEFDEIEIFVFESVYDCVW